MMTATNFYDAMYPTMPNQQTATQFVGYGFSQPNYYSNPIEDPETYGFGYSDSLDKGYARDCINYSGQVQMNQNGIEFMNPPQPQMGIHQNTYVNPYSLNNLNQYQSQPSNNPWDPSYYTGSGYNQGMNNDGRYIANPYFQNNYNQYNYNYYNPAPQPRTMVVNVPGHHEGYIFAHDFEEQVDKMEMEYYLENEVSKHKAMESQTFYSGYVDYSHYVDREILEKYQRKYNKLIEDARENSIQLYMKFTKGVHKYFDTGVTDEEIERWYRGYSYEVETEESKAEELDPKTRHLMEENEKCRYISNVDLRQMWINHYNSVNNYYKNIYGEAKSFNDILKCMDYELSLEMEEEHNRQINNGMRYVNQDIFFSNLEKLEKRLKQINPDGKDSFYDHGHINRDLRNIGDQYIKDHPKEAEQYFKYNDNDDGLPFSVLGLTKELPTLSECATIGEDGTITIHTPQWILDREAERSPYKKMEKEASARIFKEKAEFAESLNDKTRYNKF